MKLVDLDFERLPAGPASFSKWHRRLGHERPTHCGLIFGKGGYKAKLGLVIETEPENICLGCLARLEVDA